MFCPIFIHFVRIFLMDFNDMTYFFPLRLNQHWNKFSFLIRKTDIFWDEIIGFEWGFRLCLKTISLRWIALRGRLEIFCVNLDGKMIFMALLMKVFDSLFKTVEFLWILEPSLVSSSRIFNIFAIKCATKFTFGIKIAFFPKNPSFSEQFLFRIIKY